MSALSLFDQAYRRAFQRGHVVVCAAVGLRQLGIGVGTSEDDAQASFRLAEDIVDSAEVFLEGVKPYFHEVFTTPDACGHKFVYADTSCAKCGHPYCDMYLTAGLLPRRRPMGLPAIMIQ